jgi:hypothetical protein
MCQLLAHKNKDIYSGYRTYVIESVRIDEHTAFRTCSEVRISEQHTGMCTWSSCPATSTPLSIISTIKRGLGGQPCKIPRTCLKRRA